MSVWFAIPNENTYLQRTDMLEVDYEKQGKNFISFRKDKLNSRSGNNINFWRAREFYVPGSLRQAFGAQRLPAFYPKSHILKVVGFFFFPPSILARTRLLKHPRDEFGLQLPSSSSSSLTLLCLHTARPGDSKSLEKYKLAHRSRK